MLSENENTDESLTIIKRSKIILKMFRFHCRCATYICGILVFFFTQENTVCIKNKQATKEVKRHEQSHGDSYEQLQ